MLSGIFSILKDIWKWKLLFCSQFQAVLLPVRLSLITMHLDIPLYLRIANELYLKRLIVGGFEGVYEFSRNFRNEGMDRTHNPEFTCMEIYVAYKDYLWMMNFTEEMIETAALAINGTTKAIIGENEIDFKTSFPAGSYGGCY